MNNRKNYNSIVFLTVYLGLVLVGGSPQVLAQAATPRLFDVKTEIEFKDDFDNKPDGDEKIDFARSLESYFGEAENFVNAVDTSCRSDEELVDFNDHSIKVDNHFLIPFLFNAKDSFSRDFLADCLENEKHKTEKAKSSELKFYYDESELKIEISAPKLSKQRAAYLAEKFRQASNIYEIDGQSALVKTIHANTSFKSENNQVFIVTRLPRGSIDDLLAVKTAR